MWLVKVSAAAVGSIAFVAIYLFLVGVANRDTYWMMGMGAGGGIVNMSLLHLYHYLKVKTT